MSYEDGGSYTGQWEENLKHGKGIETDGNST